MPRKNNRKNYVVGKQVIFSADRSENAGAKSECIGCAFAGFGGVCKTSDVVCLKTVRGKPVPREADHAGHNG